MGACQAFGQTVSEPEILERSRYQDGPGVWVEDTLVKSLFEAFQWLDPNRTGYISDHHLFATVARALLGNQGNEATIWASLDQDSNGHVSFAEFVEWAEVRGVTLPIGLDNPEGELGPGGIAFPSTWKGPRDQFSAQGHNRRQGIVDKALLKQLQSLMDVTYKKVWTRDRKKCVPAKVPDGYNLVSAMTSENFADWKRYYLHRHHLVHHCSTQGFFEKYRPLTFQATELYERHKIRSETCNEWLLFHGTSTSSAEAICRGDFTMRLAGAATGTLYGRGTYFAESVTKADEYATEDKDGNCCMLVCRVAGGRVLYNDEVEPNAQDLQDAVLKDRLYHSIIGDREKCRNTFKEYIVFDADQVYVEYVLVYKRRFN